MICYECQESVNNAKKIGDYYYCSDCIYRNALVKCPINSCNETISLNGYDGNIDNELFTCQQCNSICCPTCINKYGRNIFCKDCINNLNDEFF